MKRVFFSIILLSFYLLAEEQKFPQPSEDLLKHLSESIRTEGWLEPAKVLAPADFDKESQGIWAGSRFKAKSQLSRVALKFQLDRDKILHDEKILPVSDADISPQEFTLTFETIGTRLAIAHSAGSTPFSRGSMLRLGDLKPRKPFELYLEGLGDSDLYLVMPAIRNPLESWGLQICPRSRRGTFSTEKKDQIEWRLAASPYRLISAFIEISGEAESVMETSFQIGSSRLELLTSAGLPITRTAEQSDQSSDPRLALKYMPINPLGFYPVISGAPSFEGLNFHAYMHKKAGYVKEFDYFHGVLIAELPTPVKALKSSKGYIYNEDLGQCYSLLVLKDSWERFSKQTTKHAEWAQ